MRGTTVATVVGGLLASGSNAIQLTKRNGEPSVVGMEIHRREILDPVKFRENQILKRQGKTVSETLDNFQQGSLYFANVTIGTPPQTFRFHIDTGSSDLWTNAKSSKLCQNDANVDPTQGQIPCTVSGTYDANSSSTYKYVNSNFQISYADGSGAQGDYVSDTLHIGGKDLSGLQMGVGYQSSSSEGVMGIGYPALEAEVQVDQQTYPNIPQVMTSQGIINSPAYSLWLDDLASSTGAILFGGVDTAKYQGSLQTLPIIPEQNMYLEMVVELDGVQVSQNGKNTTASSDKTAVLLDSGSTLSYLPVTMSKAIFALVNAQYDPQAQQAFCDCALANTSTTIDFTFSGKTIAVPISEMVLPGGPGMTASGQNLDCTFGIAQQTPTKGGGSSFTLGDTFIRSAYIVYDLSNNQISMAQTTFNAQSSNVMEIGTGANSVPNVSSVVSAPGVSITGSPSKLPGNNNAGSTGTPTGSAASATKTSGATSTSSAFAASTSLTRLGLVAGVAGVGLLLAL